MHVFVGHTVGTPEIAGIRQGNPEVIMYTSESVLDHLAGRLIGPKRPKDNGKEGHVGGYFEKQSHLRIVHHKQWGS